MQDTFRETQTLLHSGNPLSKPVHLKMGKDHRVTWIASFLQIHVPLQLGCTNLGFVFYL